MKAPFLGPPEQYYRPTNPFALTDYETFRAAELRVAIPVLWLRSVRFWLFLISHLVMTVVPFAQRSGLGAGGSQVARFVFTGFFLLLAFWHDHRVVTRVQDAVTKADVADTIAAREGTSERASPASES